MDSGVRPGRASRDTRMSHIRNFLLENLPEESRKKLLKNVSYTTIPANKYIFREGQDADYICIIQRGKVKLSHVDADGRENIIMLLSENDTIWESLFLYDGKFPYSAVTMTETRLCRIYRENFIHIMDNPQAALEIITMLSLKLHDANQRSQLLATQDPAARVAGFLLYHLERSPDAVLNYSLEDIGASICLRPETVSRKLRCFQADGLIAREGRGRLRVLDAAGLNHVFHGVDQDAE